MSVLIGGCLKLGLDNFKDLANSVIKSGYNDNNNNNSNNDNNSYNDNSNNNNNSNNDNNNY